MSVLKVRRPDPWQCSYCIFKPWPTNLEKRKHQTDLLTRSNEKLLRSEASAEGFWESWNLPEMIQGASLIKQRSRLKESFWRKLVWAQHAEEVRSYWTEWAGSGVCRWKRVNMEDWHHKAAQWKLQHQLWPWLVSMGFRWMSYNRRVNDKAKLSAYYIWSLSI